MIFSCFSLAHAFGPLFPAQKGQIWPSSTWAGAGPSPVLSLGTQALTDGHTRLLSPSGLRPVPWQHGQPSSCPTPTVSSAVQPPAADGC